MGIVNHDRNSDGRSFVYLLQVFLVGVIIFCGNMPGYTAKAQYTDVVDAQDTIPSLQQQKTKTGVAIRGDFRHFELDRLGNLFLIGIQGNQITEYNKKGDSVNHYDNVRSYGQISQLEVTNPLKIAVYYKDFATIVVLDRYLSPVNTIDLRKAGIWDAQAISSSYDNQYWVYDKQEAKIKKIDGQGMLTFASSDLRQVFDEGVDPVKLLDRDGLLYMYDTTYGWYIFDYYGALKQRIPVRDLADINVSDGILSATIQESGRRQLWMMNASAPGAVPKIIRIPDMDTIRQAQFIGQQGKLLILTKMGISTYVVGVN